MTIRNQPARVFFGQTVTERRFPAMAMFAWLSSPEAVPRSTLHSDHIPTAENNWAGQNTTGYANPAVDALIEALELELDPDKVLDLILKTLKNPGYVAGPAAHLCHGPAHPAPLLPGQHPHLAPVADRRRAHGPPVSDLPVG